VYLLFGPRQRSEVYAKPNPTRHDDGSAISDPAVARSRKRTLLSESALVRDYRELRRRSQSSGCRMAGELRAVVPAWGGQNHSAPRCEAAPGSNLATTFQLPGSEPHTQKTLSGHPVCVHSRTPAPPSGRLSDSIGRAARPRWRCGRSKGHSGKLRTINLPSRLEVPGFTGHAQKLGLLGLLERLRGRFRVRATK
jgi:hypothetical protein